MNLTHYMSLIMGNQPWNVFIFLAIPVITAETLTMTEFYILFNKIKQGPARNLNKAVGIFGGLYFTGIFIYLFINVVIPLSTTGGWNTWIDVVAVGFYLSGVVFLLPISLMELGIIFRGKNWEERLRIHSTLISGFLIVSHVAMIAGMINPEIIMPSMQQHMKM